MAKINKTTCKDCFYAAERKELEKHKELLYCCKNSHPVSKVSNICNEYKAADGQVGFTEVLLNE